MLDLFKKIISPGMVAEKWHAYPEPPGYRGAVACRRDWCTACGACPPACPTGAITMQDGYPEINNNACIFCGRCSLICPAGALGHTPQGNLATCQQEILAERLSGSIRRRLGRSLTIRHVDAGSCNACDWEMTALTNPIYDIQQYGIDFVASPRHADLLMVTGTVTRNLSQALRMTYEATPTPRLVMAVGSCACSGATYGASYAITGGVDSLVPVDVYVPGCPPRPQALLHGLLLVLDRL